MNVLSFGLLFAIQVQLSGLQSPDVHKEFIKQSVLHNANTRKKIDIRFGAQQDKLLLIDVLKANGYLQAKVKAIIDYEKEIVKFEIIPGPLYKVRNVELVYLNLESREIGVEPVLNNEITKRITIKTKNKLTFGKVEESAKQIIEVLQNNGHPNPTLKKPTIIEYSDAHEVDIRYTIIPGKKVLFGDLILTGLKNLKSNFVLMKTTWKRGEIYEKQKLELFRTKLYASGLFSIISFKERPDETEEYVDIEARLTENPPRYIGASAYFRTNEGLGGQLNWKHRNLTGYGDELDLKATGSKYFRRIETEYAIPHFFTKAQKTYTHIYWQKSDIDAYESNIVTFHPYIKTKLSSLIKLYSGIQFETGEATKKITDFINNEKKIENKPFKVQLLSLPLSLELDTTDSEHAPTQGIFWKTKIQPFLGRNKQNFTKFDTSLSYLMSTKEPYNSIPRVGWFNKIAFGHITGKELGQIVPHQRFYLGGPTNMRAYGFKLVGDLDKDKHPFGGTSFGYYISELRFRVHSKMTLNLYHEMGIVGQKGLAQLFKYDKVFHGSGISICYYSPILPIQFGVAVPWTQNRRNFKNERVDSRLQFYVGIGQIR